METIKTCPLCGAPGEVKVRTMQDGRQWYAVHCTRTTCMWVGSGSDMPDKAIRRWNTQWPRKEASDG